MSNETNMDLIIRVKISFDMAENRLKYEPLTDKQVHEILIERDLYAYIYIDLLNELAVY